MQGAALKHDQHRVLLLAQPRCTHRAQHAQQALALPCTQLGHQLGQARLIAAGEGVVRRWLRRSQTQTQLVDFCQRKVVQKQLTDQAFGVRAAQHHGAEIHGGGGQCSQRRGGNGGGNGRRNDNKCQCAAHRPLEAPHHFHQPPLPLFSRTISHRPPRDSKSKTLRLTKLRLSAE